MGDRVRPYVAGAGAGLLAKSLSLAAGFGNLWLLTQMLAKEQFAGYVFVVALLTWLAILGTAGLDRTILFRLSRTEIAPDDPGAGALVAAALLIVLPVSAVLAVIVALGTSIRRLDHLPGLDFWLTVLAPLVVTTCLGRIFEAWYWACGRVAASVLVPAAGDVARTVGLGVAFFVSPTESGVAAAVVVAALVPLLIWSVIVPLGALRRPAPPPRGDVGYGVKAMLSRAVDEGTNQLDIIVIGILATAAATADYAVAARLALVVAVVKGLLTPVLTPRLGRYSASGSREVLLREYDQVRLLGLVAALASAALFAALGRQALALFGDFERSYPLLMILVAGYVVSVGFGSNAAFLTISGHAGWMLAARLALLVVIVSLNLVLVPALGATGAALSMAGGMVAMNVFMCYAIWRLHRLPTMSPGLVILVAGAHAMLQCVAFGVLSGTAAALGLGALAAVLLVAQRPLWLPSARRLIG